MPFEFLKGKAKDKGPAQGTLDPAPKGKDKSDLAGKGFEQQSAALKPKDDGKKNPLKGGLAAIKGLFSSPQAGLDEGRQAALGSFMTAAAGCAGQAENFVIHLKHLLATVPADVAKTNKEGLDRARNALGIAKKLPGAMKSLQSGAESFMKSGNNKSFEPLLLSFVKLAADLHQAVLGHRDAGDYFTADSFLLNPMTDGQLKGGRTLSKEEKRTKTDGRQGESVTTDPSASIPDLSALADGEQGKGFDKAALMNYASYYADHFQRMSDAVVRVM